jgi:hypothetical protein
LVLLEILYLKTFVTVVTNPELMSYTVNYSALPFPVHGIQGKWRAALRYNELQIGNPGYQQWAGALNGASNRFQPARILNKTFLKWRLRLAVSGRLPDRAIFPAGYML